MEATERAVLNELILTCREGARGFEWAADHVCDVELQVLFKKIATERHEYVMELLPHAYWLGGPPDGDASRIAALHRVWMNVKSRLAPHRDHAILLEAERGDRAAMGRYSEAMHGGLPPVTMNVIERQHAGMQMAYERLQTAAARAERSN